MSNSLELRPVKKYTIAVLVMGRLRKSGFIHADHGVLHVDRRLLGRIHAH